MKERSMLFCRRYRAAVAVLIVLGGALGTWRVALWASGSLSSQLIVKVNATGASSTFGLSTAQDAVSQDYTQLLPTGTGANQASNMYHDHRTIGASTSENLDLAGTLLNAFGSTLTFTKIKGIVIHATSTNTNDVVIGGAGANGWTGAFGTNTDTIKIKPNGTFVWIAPDANGAAVTAATNDLLKVANGGAGTSVQYDVIIIGVD